MFSVTNFVFPKNKEIRQESQRPLDSKIVYIFFSINLNIFCGCSKNCPIETVLNNCFDREIKRIILIVCFYLEKCSPDLSFTLTNIFFLQQLYRKKPGMTMNAARLENNIPKNRYRDISPCKCPAWYSETCVKLPLSKRPKMVFKTDYSLMQVKSIAECSRWSILQYFQPSLSYQLSLRSLFCLFLSGHFTQVLLYIVLT